jgi:pSer/pThr/pTyr-binding forkhead associated (FHA) protein
MNRKKIKYYVVNLADGKRYELYNNKACSIGRNNSNRIVISDNFCLVSRFHGEIKLIDGKISYKDFPENHNGTFLTSLDDYKKNSEKHEIWREISRGVRTNLNHNEVLRLGGKKSQDNSTDAKICDLKIECIESEEPSIDTKPTEIASNQIKE